MFPDARLWGTLRNMPQLPRRSPPASNRLRKPGLWLWRLTPIALAMLVVAAVTYGQDATTRPEDGLRGREVSVTLDTGKRFNGTLVERTEEAVVLRIAGVRTPIERRRVDTLEAVAPLAKRYEQRRSRLDQGDLEGRRELVQWLLERGGYRLAERELETLRRRFPDNPELELLWRIVQQQGKLARDRTAATQRAATQGAVTQPAREDPLRNRLTRQQLNMIRVWEVSPSNEPRVRVPDATIRKLFQRYGDDEAMPTGSNARFRVKQAKGWQQLELLFRVRARDLYDEVRILDEPETLETFRNIAHTRYVLRFCGGAGCHGGQNRGGLYLFRRAPRSDQTIYTNFYMLSQYRQDGQRMIDRRKPDQSLLLQFGLPRDAADTPHPDVPGWRPYFQRTDNEHYLALLDMIGDLYPEPAYGIEYTPPGEPDTTRTPATKASPR